MHVDSPARGANSVVASVGSVADGLPRTACFAPPEWGSGGIQESGESRTRPIRRPF